MTSEDYSVVANLVLATHVAFVVFVVFGLVAIIIGAALDWRFARNFRFRVLHLAAIGVVVVQSWLGIVCPLTTLESALRAEAGTSPYEDGFIPYWLHSVLYYDAPGWVFIAAYTVFGLLVVASWVVVRPVRRRQQSSG